MKNLTIEQTRTSRMNHCMVKKFVSVHKRTELRKDYDGFRGWITKCLPIIYYWQPSKTSIPKKVWPIARVRRERLGQLCLLKL